MLQYAGLADQVIAAGNSVSLRCVRTRHKSLTRLYPSQFVVYNSISAFTAENTNLNPYDSHRLFPVPGICYQCSSQGFW